MMDSSLGHDLSDGHASPARAAAMDQHVGERIRERRTRLGISQQHLAATIGVTYQQAQKYEHGVNRISAGRLYEIAAALSVPITWFFEGIDAADEAPNPSARQNQSVELARNFAAIGDTRRQEALSALARALAQLSVEPGR